jgi:xanthine dehydrogenase large subunit
MTTEELIYGKDGRLLNGTASGYKVPDIKFIPDDFEVFLYEDRINDKAVFGSKAVGEPPFIYGIGVYFALQNAMKSYKHDVDLNINSPITPQKILCKLYGC